MRIMRDEHPVLERLIDLHKEALKVDQRLWVWRGVVTDEEPIQANEIPPVTRWQMRLQQAPFDGWPPTSWTQAMVDECWEIGR